MPSPRVIHCTVPDCPDVATRQWQRAATADEAWGHREAIRANVARLTETRREYVRMSIRQLQYTLNALPPDMPDRETYTQRLGEAIDTLGAELAGIVDEQLDMDGAATVAVHACETHAVDPDKATLLHEPGCHTSGPCACDHESLPVHAGQPVD